MKNNARETTAPMTMSNPGAILWSREVAGIGLFVDCPSDVISNPREDKREGETDDNHGNDQSDDPTGTSNTETPERFPEHPTQRHIGNGNLYTLRA